MSRRPLIASLATGLLLASASLAAPAASAAVAPAAAPTVAAVAAAKPPAGSIAVRVLSVYDGDTIRVRLKGKSERVRIIGINSPELKPAQCYGRQAASKMQSLAQSRTVYIKYDATQGNRDKYGRLLRHVYSTKGTSLGKVMINGGFAKEYTYNRAYRGQAGYRSAQAGARKAKRGLWGACAAPKPAPKPVATTSSCKIKGNISSSGERIYHVPGQRHYSVTVITASKGERWFCTEKQAVNAGWRKSKV